MISSTDMGASLPLRQGLILWRTRQAALGCCNSLIPTRCFSAHGIPKFGRDWLTLLDSELDKIIRGEAEYRYVTHYLATVIPWRVYQNGELYIYTTPLVDPPLFWSKWMLLMLATVFILSLYLFHRIARLPFAPGQRDE